MSKPLDCLIYFSGKFSMDNVRSGLVKMNYSSPTGLLSKKLMSNPACLLFFKAVE